MKKTNAARILDKHNIKYKILEYTVDENDLSALHVAKDTGLDIKRIFKTLVCVDERNQPLVACIPGDGKLNLKALAKAAGCKKCVMIAMKDLLKITGYMRGGCSPFGMKKQFRTFLDESAFLHVKIVVSAGVRGKQLEIMPKNMIDILGAKSAKLIF